LSKIVAAGCDTPLVLGRGSAVSTLGATPKLHIIIAPLTTNGGT
jgi:hypothetical protein